MAIQQRSHKFALRSAAVDLKAASSQTLDGITDMAALAAFAERPKVFGCFSTAVASFAEQPNGGLIVTVDANADGHRKLIFQLAERYRLPAVYPFTFFALGPQSPYNPLEPLVPAHAVCGRFLVRRGFLQNRLPSPQIAYL